MRLLFMALWLAQSWGTRPPRVVSRVEPAWTEEAHRAAVNTTIVVKLMVSDKGTPEDIRVVRGAGFGLDEMAIQAIETWRFEPAFKEGKPFQAPTRVELHFGISDKARTGQTARLNFSLSPGVQRPELIQGQVPANPDPPVDARLRIRLNISPDGRPIDFQTLESSDREWAVQAIWEMAAWRFRPALRDGKPEEVSGLFELMVSPPKETESLQNRRQGMVTILQPEPDDKSLPAPRLISPLDHALFDGYPRRLTCKWEASAGALSYLLEWDYMYQDAWNAEYRGIPGAAFIVNGTEFTFDFVGSQPGRWRVWPVNASGQRGNSSEWRTFRYLH